MWQILRPYLSSIGTVTYLYNKYYEKLIEHTSEKFTPWVFF